MAQGQTSGTYLFRPPFESLIRECYARIQIYAPQFTTEHITQARMSANLIQADWANKGPSLWVIGDEQLMIPLINGITNYQCPIETIDIFDAYLRTYQQGTALTTVGNTLTPIVMVPGTPTLGAGGEPTVMAPGSGVFSTVQGSQHVTMNYPNHGLAVGAPLFWQYPVLAGPMTLPSWVIVDSVPNNDTVTFLASQPAPATRPNVGGTPLFTAVNSTSTITVVQSLHGLSPGALYPISPAVTVGGLTLNGSYTVAAVQSLYEFTINVSPFTASSTQTVFLNGGQIQLATQANNTNWTDIFLWPLSRDEYAMLPNKNQPGRPTQFWFNRTIVPQTVMWPVPNTPSPTSTNIFYGFIAYRMRALQDAIPTGGQVLDMPVRMMEAFCAALTAACAEKFKPEQHAAKLLLADRAWDRASSADTERVSLYLAPDLTGF
jgi:hypothetical protein